MRRAVIAVLILFAAVAPARAQLAVKSRIQAEDTSNPKQTGRIVIGDLFTRFVMQLQTRRTKEVFDVKTYVRDGVVRVEGLAPLVGFPDHLILIARPDGTDTWLDPATQTFFVDLSVAPMSMGMMAIDKSPKVESKPDGTATLLGRVAAGTRTEISVQLALSAGSTGVSPPVTAFERGSEYLPRDRRIVVRTWTTAEFGDDGALAAKPGVMASLGRLLNLPSSGLPLRQIVQATSSNGFGQRWETVVTSVSAHTLPADAFTVPASYTKSPILLAPVYAR